MERCPCCNARLRDAVQCQRCGSDFSLARSAVQDADAWLSLAVHHWLQDEAEHCLYALHHSLLLKYSSLALLLRDHVVEQSCRQILDLLAQDRVLAAKQRLYRLRNSLSDNDTLAQLHAFTDYLLTRQA